MCIRDSVEDVGGEAGVAGRGGRQHAGSDPVAVAPLEIVFLGELLVLADTVLEKAHVQGKTFGEGQRGGSGKNAVFQRGVGRYGAPVAHGEQKSRGHALGQGFGGGLHPHPGGGSTWGCLLYTSQECNIVLKVFRARRQKC